MALASEDPTNPRWIGKSKIDLGKPITADQVWPLLSDFCNLNKILPNIDTSRYVEGPLGQPGMIRYCAVTMESSSSSNGGTTPAASTTWANEKLIMIDHDEKWLSYQIMENTFGFSYYVATIGVVAKADEDGGGCRIEWSFESDPVKGWNEEGFMALLNLFLQSMGKKIEELLLLH